MNILSYGLLGLLTREESSGYDLMLKIQPHWQAKHSQIYPLLSKMENEELLASRWVQQSDKPDKKMYAVTEKGIQKLLEWMITPVTAPVTRDEFNLRILCVGIAEDGSMRRILNERKSWFMERIRYFEELKARIPQDNLRVGNRDFGSYILAQKGLMHAQTGLEWCLWVTQLLDGQAAIQDPSPSISEF